MGFPGPGGSSARAILFPALAAALAGAALTSDLSRRNTASRLDVEPSAFNGDRFEPMNCRQFLTLHSEYADGLLTPGDAAPLAAHVESCAACARYDRVVRRGTELVRDLLPRVEASRDFERRVRHRLLHVRDEGMRRRAGTASVYAAATVVLLGAGAGLFLLASQHTPEVDSQVVWVSPPAATPLRAKALAVGAISSDALVPLATAAATIEAEAAGQDAHVASSAAWPVYSRGAVAVAFPGSHTSLVVTPADFRLSSTRQPAGPLLVRH